MLCFVPARPTVLLGVRASIKHPSSSLPTPGTQHPRGKPARYLQPSHGQGRSSCNQRFRAVISSSIEGATTFGNHRCTPQRACLLCLAVPSRCIVCLKRNTMLSFSSFRWSVSLFFFMWPRGVRNLFRPNTLVAIHSHRHASTVKKAGRARRNGKGCFWSSVALERMST